MPKDPAWNPHPIHLLREFELTPLCTTQLVSSGPQLWIRGVAVRPPHHERRRAPNSSARVPPLALSSKPSRLFLLRHQVERVDDLRAATVRVSVVDASKFGSRGRREVGVFSFDLCQVYARPKHEVGPPSPSLPPH